jgi:hypothetical protein
MNYSIIIWNPPYYQHIVVFYNYLNTLYLFHLSNISRLWILFSHRKWINHKNTTFSIKWSAGNHNNLTNIVCLPTQTATCYTKLLYITTSNVNINHHVSKILNPLSPFTRHVNVSRLWFVNQLWTYYRMFHINYLLFWYFNVRNLSCSHTLFHLLIKNNSKLLQSSLMYFSYNLKFL